MIFEKLNWKKLPLFFIAILFVPFVAFSVPEEVNLAKSSTVSDFVQTEEQKKAKRMQDKFNQDIEELGEETDSLVEEIEKWQI